MNGSIKFDGFGEEVTYELQARSYERVNRLVMSLSKLTTDGDEQGKITIRFGDNEAEQVTINDNDIFWHALHIVDRMAALEEQLSTCRYSLKELGDKYAPTDV